GGCANRMPGGCGSLGSGCLPSWAMGCQRIGCGLLSFLLLLALLLWLLRECNNATSTNNDEKAYDEVRVDTVRVYETDTVETVILDTLFSVDTIQLTDTMYTVIKNALPLPNVLFKSNSAIIRASSLEGIKSLGDSLNAHTDINMIIAGHTDASGDNYHNDSLSFCRAKAVRDVLVDSCGISADRLMFEGYGENCPIEDNKSIEGKTTNRRVEFRYFGESIGKCEEFKIQIDEDVCNSGSYLSSVEIPKFTNDTILNHKIKHLETLYSISKKYNVSIDELINLNPGVDNGLITGRVIKIPVSAFVKPTQSDESDINAEWFTIKDKDGYVNVRSGRNIASRILYRIRVNQQFQVIDQSHNKWWKIIFKNTEGFIHSSRVIKVESNNE
ncbi:MAG: OmpA family protein, partial [Flavobacteriales bacterium]|nr:OmpA family protein [Flavobacteriales bacterium]